MLSSLLKMSGFLSFFIEAGAPVARARFTSGRGSTYPFTRMKKHTREIFHQHSPEWKMHKYRLHTSGFSNHTVHAAQCKDRLFVLWPLLSFFPHSLLPVDIKMPWNVRLTLVKKAEEGAIEMCMLITSLLFDSLSIIPGGCCSLRPFWTGSLTCSIKTFSCTP